MIIKTLLENRTISDEFETEHGFSLYIETGNRKILFDTGETDMFVRNAEKLDVNIKDVDMVIISHGHYDHAGGLKAFLKINEKAKVYIQKEAFIPHASFKEEELKIAGIDVELKENDRIVLVDEDIYFDNDLVLFSHVKGRNLVPRGNSHLLMESKEGWIQDNFHHEQNLIIKEGDLRVLVVGCSHRGIVNILEQSEKHLDKPLTQVLGGFHLYDIDLESKEDLEFLGNVSDEIISRDAVYYTGHCTGYDQYKKLKEKLQDRLHYLATGTILDLVSD